MDKKIMWSSFLLYVHKVQVIPDLTGNDPDDPYLLISVFKNRAKNRAAKNEVKKKSRRKSRRGYFKNRAKNRATVF